MCLQGGLGRGTGSGRGARGGTGGGVPGEAGGTRAPGASDGDDGADWAYVNTTHIIADITVEEVLSPDPAAGGSNSGSGGPEGTAASQVGGSI